MKNKTKRAVSQVVIATGISAVVAQLLIIREFLTRFMGNEFVISLILFNWLFLGAAGALFARFVNKYHPETIDYVALNPEVTKVLFRFGMIKKFRV